MTLLVNQERRTVKPEGLRVERAALEHETAIRERRIVLRRDNLERRTREERPGSHRPVSGEDHQEKGSDEPKRHKLELVLVASCIATTSAEDLARSGAVRGADDALLLKEVHEARGAGVADTKLALEIGG